MRFEFSAGAIIYKIERGNVKFLFLISPKGDLDIPKGHIEKDEDSYSAAKREIKEESGLDVNFIPYFKYVNKYFFYENKEKILKTVTIFIAKVGENSKVKISWEHKGYKWLTFEEAIKEVNYKDMKVLLSAVNDYIQRYEAMEQLNKEYRKLSDLKGWNLSKRFVPGEGPLNAKITLIGQAPGNEEDKQQRPFVGRSGKLLDEILKKSKIKRSEIYITSAVQFFPPANRVPTAKEIELCKPFLEKQIKIIKPKFIILLGSVASKATLGVENVDENHGKTVKKEGITYFITYHPAAALRFPEIKKRMYDDFEKFKKMIEARS